MKTTQTMLKHLYIAVFFIAFVCAAWLVALQRQEILQASVPIENRTVLLENSSDKNEAPSPSTMQQRAAITPFPEELFLKTIDINLDDDEDFEQIIVSKKGPSSTLLEIVVADFLSTLGIYSRYFDGAVAATKLDSIIVQTMDMTADGLPDLIVQGSTNSITKRSRYFKDPKSGLFEYLLRHRHRHHHSGTRQLRYYRPSHDHCGESVGERRYGHPDDIQVERALFVV